MNRPVVRPAALAGLLALLWLAPAARAGGVVMAAPSEMADSLRAEAPAPAAPRAPEPPAPPAPYLPLVLDTADFGFGASIVYGRLPDLRDLNDVANIPGVQHVVLSLAEWPSGYEALQPLAQSRLPEGADLLVILPGYPPTHAAAEAWNYLRIPVRIVMVVEGPPASRGAIDELNRIRGLERVIADVQDPSRSGFERLQRPLSFRVVMR